jgi:WD40 repeat protein
MFERDIVDWTAEKVEKKAEAQYIYPPDAIRMEPTGFIVNYDNSLFATVNEFDLADENLRAELHLWEGKSGKILWTMEQKNNNGYRPVIPSFSADGRYLAAFDGQRTVWVIDSQDIDHTESFAVGTTEEIVALAFHSISLFTVVCLNRAIDKEKIRTASIDTGKCFFLMLPSKFCHGTTVACYSQHGKTLFVITWNRGVIDIYIYNGESMQTIARRTFEGDSVTVQMFSPFSIGGEDALVLQIWGRHYKSIFSRKGTHEEKVVIVYANGRDAYSTVEKEVYSLMTVSQGALVMCRKIKEDGSVAVLEWDKTTQKFTKRGEVKQLPELNMTSLDWNTGIAIVGESLTWFSGWLANGKFLSSERIVQR